MPKENPKLTRARRVRCPLRTGVTLRASLLGTNPVGLPKMKVPKEYPRPTRAGRVGCPTGGLECLLGQNC